MDTILLELRTVDADRAYFGARVPVVAAEGGEPLPGVLYYGKTEPDQHRVDVGTWLRRDDWEQRGAPLAIPVEVRAA